MKNKELIKKVVESGNFGGAYGGQLQPEQQKQFIVMIRDNSRMMKYVDYKSVGNKRGEFDRLHLNEPITRRAPENTLKVETTNVLPTQVKYDCEKVQSCLDITTEAMEDNIEQEGIESTVQNMIAKQVSIDFENLAINGDDAITGTTNLEELLKIDDGWDKLTDGVHIVDAGGAYLSDEILAEAVRRMPDHYMNDPGVRWFFNRRTMVDLAQHRSNRDTSGGDDALSLKIADPFGVPFLDKMGLPLIPSNKPLALEGLTPAMVLGMGIGPWKFVTGVNDTFSINVDGAGMTNVVLPESILETYQVCALINASVGVDIARDNGHGRIILESPSTGIAGSSLAIGTGNANGDLGFSNLSYAGSDAGTAGIVNEGTFIWLANPKNFWFRIFRGTRAYSEYNKDYDRVENVIYNSIDQGLHNPDAMVKIKNLRTRTA